MQNYFPLAPITKSMLEMDWMSSPAPASGPRSPPTEPRDVSPKLIIFISARRISPRAPRNLPQSRQAKHSSRFPKAVHGNK